MTVTEAKGFITTATGCARRLRSRFMPMNQVDKIVEMIRQNSKPALRGWKDRCFKPR